MMQGMVSSKVPVPLCNQNISVFSDLKIVSRGPNMKKQTLFESTAFQRKLQNKIDSCIEQLSRQATPSVGAQPSSPSIEENKRLDKASRKAQDHSSSHNNIESSQS